MAEKSDQWGRYVGMVSSVANDGESAGVDVVSTAPVFDRSYLKKHHPVVADRIFGSKEYRGYREFENKRDAVVTPDMMDTLLVTEYGNQYGMKEGAKTHVGRLDAFEAAREAIRRPVTPKEQESSIADAETSGVVSKRQAAAMRAIVASMRQRPDFAVTFDPKIASSSYRLADNMVNVKNPVDFAHEVGHWAFWNVLGPEDRKNIYKRYVEDYYQPITGEVNRGKMNSYLAMKSENDDPSEPGKKWVSNSTDSVAEFFANQFMQYVHSRSLTTDEHMGAFEKVSDWARGIRAETANEKILDPNLSRYFGTLVQDRKERGVEPRAEIGGYTPDSLYDKASLGVRRIFNGISEE